MVPPRLTLVRSSSDANDTTPASGGARGTGGDAGRDSGRASGRDAGSDASRDPQRAQDASRDAAEALAELARSALAAADVVTGSASGSSGRPPEAQATPGTSDAAKPAKADTGADGSDAPPQAISTVEAEMHEGAAADGTPIAIADPEAEQPALRAAVAQAVPGTPAGKVECAEALRILEAMLFAASEPLDERRLAEGLGKASGGAAIGDLLVELQRAYQPRGVNLVRVAGKWAFRTAEDLSWLLERHASEERRLSKAALETLSIIAYHQPVTRAEIEDIRGVSTSAGTLDILLETGWVRPRGRRRAPGRPVTYGTTEAFLNHFGLDTVKDLPGLAELKGAGLLDNTLPASFTVPEPCDVAALMPDELPLDAADEEPAQGEMELDAEAADGSDPLAD